MTLDRRNLLKQLGIGMAAGSFLRPVRASAAANNSGTTEIAPIEHPGPIHLDRNENAYGASKKAIIAIQKSSNQASRYPDAKLLQNALAAHHSQNRTRSVQPDQIVPGCGSSDVLRMVASAFLSADKTLILATPTCALPSNDARKEGAEVVEIPLLKDHSHDLKSMLERANQQGAAGLIYVCNPNSPTGTMTNRKNLEEFLAKVPPNFHVVIDEAYHEYAGGSGSYASFIDRPTENPRVIVTRTFSAAYGLAGARVGYAVASVPVAEKISKESLLFAIGGAGIAAAMAALDDQQHIEICAERNFDDRQEFMNQVNARMLRVFDSHTNFVCLNVMRPAGEILEHYQKNNFALPALIPSLPTYLRISLGTPEEMKEFWRVWDLLGSHPMSM
jgi:histidinol-phosphate aminotransferase